MFNTFVDFPVRIAIFSKRNHDFAMRAAIGLNLDLTNSFEFGIGLISRWNRFAIIVGGMAITATNQFFPRPPLLTDPPFPTKTFLWGCLYHFGVQARGARSKAVTHRSVGRQGNVSTAVQAGNGYLSEKRHSTVLNF